MSKYKAMKMNTTSGSIYTIMFHDGEGWVSARASGRYYKTEAGANRAIQKLLRG